MEQACEGLHYAHRHGVVHRDVKPGNLMRSRERVVKLADFGIAKATEQSSITQVGSVLGTAAYLAPEQARGEEAGPQADLYALGVVAYQLISGRLPYEAASLTELALKQQQEQPPALDELVAAVTPELADAVAVALALEPGDRHADARAMGRALREGARGVPVHETHGREHATQATSLLSASSARGRSPAAGAGTRVTPRRPRPGPPRKAPPVQATRPQRRSRGARRALGALALLALVGVVIALIVSLSTPASTRVRLTKVVYSEVQRSAEALSRLVSENTK
jgi:serine/threonine-protein kinase